MAVNVGDLEATIRLLDELSPELKNVEKNVGGFSKKSSALMGFFMGAGQMAFQAVTQAAVSMARDVPLALFNAASAAEESENLFAVSFGEMADSARQWSVELAKATGQNEFTLRKNAATLFVMTESMGVASDKAYDMATALTGLAGDLASFYDLPHEEAFGKIQAGISGEAEPLKRIGILVTENVAQQAALRHGLIRTGETMDEATKVQARYLAIMDQTVKAQGDLARTIDSPANAVRALTSQWEALQIHLGQALMPAFRAVIKVMGGLLGVIMDNREAITGWVRTMAVGLVGILPTVVKGLQWVDNALTVLIVGYRSFRHGILKTVEVVQKANLAYLKLVGTAEDVARAEAAVAATQAEIAENARKAGEDLDANARRANEGWAKLQKAAEGVVEEVTALGSGGSAGMAVKDLKTNTEAAGLTFEKFLEVTAPVQTELVPGLTAARLEMERLVAEAPNPFAGMLESSIALTGHVDVLTGTIRQQFQKLAAETPGMFSIPLKAGLQKGLADLPGVMLGAIQGGGDVIKAVGASLGGTLGESIGPAITSKLTPMLGESLAQGLGSLAGPLGSLAGQLVGSLVGKIGGLFRDEEMEKLNDIRDAFLETHGGFEQLAITLSETGNQDMVQRIFDAQSVEEFNALVEETNELLALPETAWEKTREAAERYGLTVEELGPAFAEAQLHEQAGQLLQDFRLLEASGADMDAVMAKMGPNVSEFVQQSIRAGVAVPEAMRPMLEQMAEAGTLLDENGNAITNLEDAGVTFAKTMDEMFTDLVDKIDQLVNALLGINDVNVAPNVPTPGTGRDRPPHQDQDGRTYQQGFYTPSMPGSRAQDGGTNIRVHEGEEVSVVPASMSDGGAGEQPLQVVVHIGPEKLYDMVTKATKAGQVRVYPDAVKSF